MTAEQNLVFYARIWHLPASESRERIARLLEQFELTAWRRMPVRDFSHGMRQRLALARALLHDPHLLLLDEPWSGLDPVARDRIHADLRDRVRRDGMTICLTTHNLAEVETFCDQVAVLRAGQLVVQGEVDQLRRQFGPHPRVTIIGRFGSTDMVARLAGRPDIAEVTQDGHALHVTLKPGVSSVSALLRQIVEAGADIVEVRREQSDLEVLYHTILEESPGE